MKKIELISNYLDELYPNPKCELNYNKDYELLIAVMLSTQTLDKRVNEVTKVLWNKYKDLNDIMNANISDLKEILKPLGNYNKKAIYLKDIAITLVTKYNSKLPRDRNKLEKIKGVGRKTINVVFAELKIKPEIAVDTHVYRVSKRLNLTNKNSSVLDTEKKLRRIFKKEEWSKRHLQLVLFGRYICKAKKPMCENCKLKKICIYYKETKNGKNINK